MYNKTISIFKGFFMWKFFLSFLFLFFISTSSEARRGCCSHHKGVQSCDSSSGRLVCNDGTFSPTCMCEGASSSSAKKSNHKNNTKKQSVKKEIVRNYNCQTMVITDRLATYYKNPNTSVNLGALIEKTKVVKTGNFKNNMFEVKITDYKDRVWIKKEDCSCL